MEALFRCSTNWRAPNLAEPHRSGLRTSFLVLPSKLRVHAEGDVLVG